ncbi:hypothetical protein Hanom_Chr16g01463281 [Helianthus anomalus]
MKVVFWFICSHNRRHRRRIFNSFMCEPARWRDHGSVIASAIIPSPVIGDARPTKL